MQIKQQLFLLSLLIAALFSTAFSLPDQLLRIYFLNVGQGDSALIVTPFNQKILIDGGPGTQIIQELSTVLPFYDKTIDLLVLTHPDKDHIEGTIEVLQQFKVRQILFTGINSQSSLYQAFLQEVSHQKIPTIIATANQDFQIHPNFTFNIIYPQTPIAGQTFAAPNNSSIVFRAQFKDLKILFTGDIEAEIEAQILVQNPASTLQSHILKVPHHGSRTSTTPEFLATINPQTAIIQAAPDSPHNHPHPEILARLNKHKVLDIRRNDLEGRLELLTNGYSYQIRPHPD